MKPAHPNGWMDISVPLYPGMAHWPGDPEFRAERVRSLDRGDVCNLTALSTSAHIGTHMDAPKHFIRDGMGMDELPLDAVIGPCRVVAIHDPVAISPAELEGQGLKGGDRVLFKTSNSTNAWGRSDFVEDFVYISKEGARWLVEHQIQTVGVDYLSIGGFFKDGVETHQILLGAGVWVIEGLNLSAIEPGDYELVCLPLKIRGSDGAPARAILRAL